MIGIVCDLHCPTVYITNITPTRTLADLNLRGITGASVIAITHGKQGVVVPTGKERLQEGDILAITGTEEALKLSKQLLLGRE